MKKILGLFCLGIFLSMSIAVTAQSQGLMTMLSTGDEFTQGCALGLLSVSMKNPNVAPNIYGNTHLLLCGDAINLAINQDTTNQIEPMDDTLWNIVGGMMGKGLNVYLCPLVVKNPPYKNLINLYGLRDGVKVVTKHNLYTGAPTQIDVFTVTEIINEPGMQIVSYGGTNR